MCPKSNTDNNTNDINSHSTETEENTHRGFRRRSNKFGGNTLLDKLCIAEGGIEGELDIDLKIKSGRKDEDLKEKTSRMSGLYTGLMGV